METNIISFPGLGIGEMKIDPVAFRIPLPNGESWPVAWYGIIITVGFLVAFAYAYYRAKKEKFSTEDLLDYLLFGMIFGVVGARLYYVLTKLDAFVVEGNIGKTLYQIVAVWGGGLAIYGGIIGGALTVLVISRIKKQSFLQVADLIAPGVAVAQAIGRWGNFVNAEAHGGVTSLPWRMGIPTPRMYEMVYVHPTFLYESLWNLAGFFFLHFFVTPKRKYYGTNLLCYIAWYGVGRMFIEGLRTDSLYIPGTEIRISQLLAFVSALVAGILLLYFAVSKKTSPGLAALQTCGTEPKGASENAKTSSSEKQICEDAEGHLRTSADMQEEKTENNRTESETREEKQNDDH